MSPPQDFGDYQDGYYSVQTTEGEQIAQLIAGYIDIILKKVRRALAAAFGPRLRRQDQSGRSGGGAEPGANVSTLPRRKRAKTTLVWRETRSPPCWKTPCPLKSKRERACVRALSLLTGVSPGPQVHGAAAAVQQGGEGGDGLGGPAGHHALGRWGSRELRDGLHAPGQAARDQRTDAPRTHASSGSAAAPGPLAQPPGFSVHGSVVPPQTSAQQALTGTINSSMQAVQAAQAALDDLESLPPLGTDAVSCGPAAARGRGRAAPSAPPLSSDFQASQAWRRNKMDESKHEIHSQVDAITAGTASMVNLTGGRDPLASQLAS